MISAVSDQGKPEGIVIFAHVPPPLHGQSLMVESMLRGATFNIQHSTSNNQHSRFREADGGNQRSAVGGQRSRDEGRESRAEVGGRVFHVDARVSESLEDVGGRRPGKLWMLLGHCRQALGFRFREGARTLYFIPAPPKASAILRDVVVMLLLRPFFSRLVLHWHAVGLGAWVEGRPVEGWPPLTGPSGWILSRVGRPLLRCLLKGANPAVVVAEGNRWDAEVFQPERVVVAANGIADLRPDFAELLAEKQRRRAKVRGWLAKRGNPGGEDAIRVLFLGQCSRQKGFFEALEGLADAARRDESLRWRLDIAGRFVSDEEEAAAAEPMSRLDALGVQCHRHGFVGGDAKVGLLTECDILLFPSRAESFGLVAVEAMCCGLPVIATDLPGILAVLDTLGTYVKPGSAMEIGRALVNPDTYADPGALRERYLQEFTETAFHDRMRGVFSDGGSGMKAET